MQHRHNGIVKYRTRKNNIRYRKKPIHSQSLIRRRNRQFRKPVRRFLRLAPEEEIEETKRFYVTPKSEDIFISRWPTGDEDEEQIANMITHEEIHKILNKEFGKAEFAGFDAITIPAFMTDDGTLLNPKTVDKITPFDNALEMVKEEMGDKFDEDFEKAFKYRHEEILDKVEDIKNQNETPTHRT